MQGEVTGTKKLEGGKAENARALTDRHKSQGRQKWAQPSEELKERYRQQPQYSYPISSHSPGVYLVVGTLLALKKNSLDFRSLQGPACMELLF